MKKATALLAVCLATVFVFTGCVPVDPGEQKDQFEVVRSAVDTFLTDAAAAVKAETTFDLLNDGDDTNDPYVLSVRSAEHYALGHVPGAENVPWREVANEGALDSVPTDQPITVYCYTGHTGGAATLVMGAMGYDATNMKYGMTAWTRDEDIRVFAPYDEETGSDFPTVTDPTEATETFELPELNVTTSQEDAEIIRAAGEAYLSAGTAPTITAEALFDILNDGDDTNDPFVISVRSPEAYALGHIEGAINIPWKQIVKTENLEKIPADQDIVVYCFTGHSGALATTALNMLGYNATNMKFGMVAWTKDNDIRATSAFDDAVDSHDYPTEP